MTQSGPTKSTKHRSHRSRFRLPLILVLIAIVFLALAYCRERFYLPGKMLAEAISMSDHSLYEAEKVAADAIEQAGGKYPEAELFRTQLLAAQGRGDEALGQFSLISRPEDLPAEKLCDLGRVAMSRREMLLAEKAFSLVSSDSESYVQVLRSLVQIHMEMGKDDQTIRECRELVELAPDDSTAWQILGTISMNRKELSEAATAFQNCLKYSTDALQAQQTREDLIQVFIDQGNTEEAKKELSALSKLHDSLSPRAVIEHAYVLRLEGSQQDAITLLGPLIERNDDITVRALFLRGLLYADLGQDQKAVDDLTLVTKQQPWHKEAHHKLSVLWSRLGNKSLAHDHRRKAEELTALAMELLDATNQLTKTPSNMELRTRVAFLYSQLGQPDQAQRLLNVPSLPQ
jgi:tetratricopeptide (TPR) repeat protein